MAAKTTTTTTTTTGRKAAKTTTGRKAATAGKAAKTAASAASIAAAADAAAAAAADLPPLPPTEGMAASVAAIAHRVNLSRGSKADRARALAEIVGPVGPHVKGRGAKARPKGGRAARDYRAVTLAIFRDAVVASPVHPGPLPEGAIGHDVARPGGHPGHVLTGADAPRHDVIPAASMTASALIGYAVAPVDVSSDGKQEKARPTALYAVTRPGKGDTPARIVTFSGHRVGDVCERIGALSVDGDRIRKTPWESVDIPTVCERHGVAEAGKAVARVLAALAAADAIAASDGVSVSAMRDDLQSARRAATADEAGGKVAGAPAAANTDRDLAAARIVKRYDNSRKRTKEALDTIREAVRVAKRSPASARKTRTRTRAGGETAA